jgi:hypothetical protein
MPVVQSLVSLPTEFWTSAEAGVTAWAGAVSQMLASDPRKRIDATEIEAGFLMARFPFWKSGQFTQKFALGAIIKKRQSTGEKRQPVPRQSDLNIMAASLP